MEDTHGVFNEMADRMKEDASLNPYYNGRYSWSAEREPKVQEGAVLILIVMEDTHGGPP